MLTLLSEKINKINQLPDSDDKKAVVMEIEALEAFTEDERSSIFGNSSVIWLLKNFTVRELKLKAAEALEKPDVSIGDVILYGPLKNQRCIVLEVVGSQKDRLTIEFMEDDHFIIKEGISVYDVVTTGNRVDITDFLKEVRTVVK